MGLPSCFPRGQVHRWGPAFAAAGRSHPCQSEALAESHRVGPRTLWLSWREPRERDTSPAAAAGLCGYQVAIVTGMETLR